MLDEDAEYLELARWLAGAVLLRIGDDVAYTLYFHKGRLIDVDRGVVVTGWDFAIAGPADEWARLISGAIDLGRATSPPVGRLRFEGNVVLASGNMRSLVRVCQKMADVPFDAEMAT
jgi:hypothetical protein